MALSKQNRLKTKKDFDRVFKKGNAVKGNFLFIKYLDGKSPNSRIGLIVPAKIVASAVERNKIKRLISELVRQRVKTIVGTYDIAIMLRVKGDKKQIEADLDNFFNK